VCCSQPQNVVVGDMAHSTCCVVRASSKQRFACPSQALMRPISQNKIFTRLVFVLRPTLPPLHTSPAATKMFIMVQAPASQAPPAGFLPRRGFSLNLRKAFQVGTGGAWPDRHCQSAAELEVPCLCATS
jgi:hypothetical protein